MIGLISINYKTASLSRREQFALSALEASELVRSWKEEGLVLGALVLSTCNRLEILYEASKQCGAARSLINSLYRYKRLRSGDEGIFTTLQGRDAIAHIFRLACGLESMVRGETQILGQLKEAYRQAADAEQTTSQLSRLCHKAFETAKKVRSEYLVSATPISAGAAAVNFLASKHHDFHERAILILGAGQMAEVICERLQGLGHSNILLYNRTEERAKSFAQRHGIKHVFYEGSLAEAIRQSSVIFVATSSQKPILTEELLPEQEERGYYLLFDMAVPRNIDPALSDRHDTRLYTIDDLKAGSSTAETPENAAIEQLLEEMIEEFIAWCEATQVRSVIAQIQKTSQKILAKELRQLPSSLSQEERTLISHWDEHLRISYTTAIVSALRQLCEQTGQQRYAELLQRIFTHIDEQLPHE